MDVMAIADKEEQKQSREGMIRHILPVSRLAPAGYTDHVKGIPTRSTRLTGRE
jgi:hypothetical protein